MRDHAGIDRTAKGLRLWGSMSTGKEIAGHAFGTFACEADSCFDEQGNIHSADVWESVDAMNTFVGTRLAPAMQKLKIPMPEVVVFPAHNANLYPAAQRYMLK